MVDHRGTRIDLVQHGAEWNPDQIGLEGACGDDTALWTRETLPSGWGDTYDYWRYEQWIGLGQSNLAGGNYVVVASKGGAPTNPLWYENLIAHPEVRVQVKGDKFAARARDATPEERPRLWQLMTSLWPAYDEYQAKTERRIPLVVLEPVS